MFYNIAELERLLSSLLKPLLDQHEETNAITSVIVIGTPECADVIRRVRASGHGQAHVSNNFILIY